MFRRHSRELQALKGEVAALRARLDGESTAASSDGVDSDQPRIGRRALLRRAGVAGVAGVGGALLAASPAGALHDPAEVGLGLSAQSAGSALTGVTSSASLGTFRADNSGSGFALNGIAESGAAVNANSVSGVGVQAFSSFSNSVYALAPNDDGGGAHLRFGLGSVSGPPTGSHVVGQFWMDSVGVLWQCVGAGSPGTWVRQAPLVTLAAPSRVYDSRTGQPNPSGSTQGTLAFGAGARTINCSPAVPTGGSSILFNLTATNTAGSGAGALLVWAAGATEPLASSINWSGAGQTLANGVTSACNSSQDVQVKCVASSGSSTNFILDVIGYYL